MIFNAYIGIGIFFRSFVCCCIVIACVFSMYRSTYYDEDYYLSSVFVGKFGVCVYGTE